jgi:hypothetical protein
VLDVRSSSLRVRPGGLWSLFSWIGIAIALPLVLRGLGSPTLLLVAVLLLIPVLSQWAYGFPRKNTRIVVQPDHLRMFLDGGERDVTIRDVASAHAESAHVVVLSLESGTRIRAELTHARADELLRTFGFDLERRALTAPLRGTFGHFTRTLLAFLLSLVLAVPLAVAALGPDGGGLAGFGVALALSTWLGARYGRPRVLVGADGLRLTGGLRSRFIPFSDVVSVTETTVTLPRDVSAQYIRDIPGWGIRVVLRGNDSVHLPTIGQSEAEMTALVTRIRAGMGTYRPASGRPLDELLRNGRTLAQWKDELRAWQTREASFREQPIDAAALERVLADASAPVERRVGAALALQQGAETEAAPRIRIAAETSANESVRRALEAVNDDTLDDDLLLRIVGS